MVPGMTFLFLFISQRSNKLSCSAEDYRVKAGQNSEITDKWGDKGRMRIFFSVFMTGPQRPFANHIRQQRWWGKVQKCIMICSVTELKKILLLMTSGICCLRSQVGLYRSTLICKTDIFMKCCTLPDSILKYPGEVIVYSNPYWRIPSKTNGSDGIYSFCTSNVH